MHVCQMRPTGRDRQMGGLSRIDGDEAEYMPGQFLLCFVRLDWLRHSEKARMLLPVAREVPHLPWLV
jgi:hypothetical protein